MNGPWWKQSAPEVSVSRGVEGRNTGMLESLSTFGNGVISESVSLTLPASEAIGYGPFTPVSVALHRDLGVQPRESTVVSLNVHSLTHMDLPWTVPLDVWEGYANDLAVPLPELLPTPKQIKDFQDLCVHAHVLRAIVVDATAKMRVLLNALAAVSGVENDSVDPWEFAQEFDDLGPASVVPAGFHPFQQLPHGMTEGALEQLLIDLLINGDELAPALAAAEASDVSDCLLLFKTGWSAWRPRSEQTRDLRHPVFNCWHPFLLHPYLDLSTLESVGAFAGIGSDCVDLDCPAYDLDEGHNPSYGSLKRRLLGGDTLVKLPSSARVKAMHAFFLGHLKWYLSNLSFPAEGADVLWGGSAVMSGKSVTGPFPFVEARVLLAPLPIGSEYADAVPLSVHLLPLA